MNRRELLKSAAGLAGAAVLSRRGWAGERATYADLLALETRLAHDPVVRSFICCRSGTG